MSRFTLDELHKMVIWVLEKKLWVFLLKDIVCWLQDGCLPIAYGIHNDQMPPAVFSKTRDFCRELNFSLLQLNCLFTHLGVIFKFCRDHKLSVKARHTSYSPSTFIFHMQTVSPDCRSVQYRSTLNSFQRGRHSPNKSGLLHQTWPVLSNDCLLTSDSLLKHALRQLQLATDLDANIQTFLWIKYFILLNRN